MKWKTQRDGTGREAGGGIRMWNTCKSMANSWQCMANTILLSNYPTTNKIKWKKKDPVPQFPWEDRNLTLEGILLQVVKLSPAIHIQKSLFFLWVKPVSRRQWPKILLTQLFVIAELSSDTIAVSLNYCHNPEYYLPHCSAISHPIFCFDSGYHDLSKKEPNS